MHIVREFGSDCKKSCVQLEYIGELDLNMPGVFDCTKLWSDTNNCSMYHLVYKLTNDDDISKVYKEYYIYDTIGMMGSVGGTLGT